MDVRQALAAAWSRTRSLLFLRGSRRRWLSFGLLHMLSGSSGSFSPSGGSSPAAGQPDLPAAKRGAAAGVLSALPALVPHEWFWPAVALVVCVLLLAAGFMWLSSVARVVMVENIVHDRDNLLEPMGRLGGLGASVFLVSALSSLVVFSAGIWLLAGLVAGLPHIRISGDPAENTAQVMLLMGFVAAVTGVLLPLLLASLLFNLTNNELVIPVMYHENVGAFTGWARVLRLGLRRPGPALIWVGVRVLLGLVTGFVEMFCQALFLGFLVLALGVPTLVLVVVFNSQPALMMGTLMVASLLAVLIALPGMAVVGTPFSVFWRCFSMDCLQQLQPSWRFFTVEDGPLDVV